MSDILENYLETLRKALNGADPATVRDALADAEEHIREAVAMTPAGDDPDAAIRAIIEEYGSAEEVAGAYRDIEQRTTPPMARSSRSEKRSFLARFFGVLIEPRSYGAIFYMLFSLVTGTVYFTWAVTGLSLSAGLLVLIIGIPFIGLFLLSIQGFALVEGRIVEALLGVRMPRRPVFARKDLGIWQRFGSLIKDRRTWLTMLYMILLLPLGTAYFSVFLTLIVLSLNFIFRPILELVFGLPMMNINNVTYWTSDWMQPFVVLAGFLMLIITIHLARITGWVHGRFAKFMLVK
jgi:hypothetical protein